MRIIPTKPTIKVTREGISLTRFVFLFLTLLILPVILFFTLVALKAPEPLPLLALLLMGPSYLISRLIAKRTRFERLAVDIPVRGGLDETHKNIVDWLSQRGFRITSEEKVEGRFVHGTIALSWYVKLHVESTLREDAFGGSIHGEFYYFLGGLGLNLEIAPTKKILSLGWYPGGYRLVEEFVYFVSSS